MPQTPLLLDTDPGNDIDDALAISYLLCHPECELLGITTVTGDTAKRAAIAEVLCHAVGRDDVPIVAGRGDVLAHGPGQVQNRHYDAIAHLPHRLDRRPDQAVDFLRQTIRARPGEVTLLSIGPFSNVALLFALDPEIPFLLKRLVSMAGAFWGNDNHEWNCLCDPSATAMVARSPRAIHTWIGLDVTMQCVMECEEVRARFTGPVLSLVLTMAEKWLEHTPRIVFHDPLAAAVVFRQELCSYDAGSVTVEPLEGKTHFTHGSGTDRVAFGVDREAFFGEFFGVVDAFQSGKESV